MLAKKRDEFWTNRYKIKRKNLEKLLFVSKKTFFQKYFEDNLHNAKKILGFLRKESRNRFFTKSSTTQPSAHITPKILVAESSAAAPPADTCFF